MLLNEFKRTLILEFLTDPDISCDIVHTKEDDGHNYVTIRAPGLPKTKMTPFEWEQLTRGKCCTTCGAPSVYLHDGLCTSCELCIRTSHYSDRGLSFNTNTDSTPYPSSPYAIPITNQHTDQETVITNNSFTGSIGELRENTYALLGSPFGEWGDDRVS